MRDGTILHILRKRMLTSVSNILIALLFIYCALSVAYLFVFALAGRLFYRKEAGMSTNPVKRIAILVPAHKEDGIILSTAKNLLSLDYPSHLFQVYILADSFQKRYP